MTGRAGYTGDGIPGILGKVQKMADVYTNNPNPLKEAVKNAPKLDPAMLEALALQKITSEKEAASRQMQIAAQEKPSVIKQLEGKALEQTKNEIAQQAKTAMGIKQNQQQKAQKALMKDQLAKQQATGIASIGQQQRPPAPMPMPKEPPMRQQQPRIQRAAQGGLMSFNNGGIVESAKRMFAKYKQGDFTLGQLQASLKSQGLLNYGNIVQELRRQGETELANFIDSVRDVKPKTDTKPAAQQLTGATQLNQLTGNLKQAVDADKKLGEDMEKEITRQPPQYVTNYQGKRVLNPALNKQINQQLQANRQASQANMLNTLGALGNIDQAVAGTYNPQTGQIDKTPFADLKQQAAQKRAAAQQPVVQQQTVQQTGQQQQQQQGAGAGAGTGVMGVQPSRGNVPIAPGLMMQGVDQTPKGPQVPPKGPQTDTPPTGIQGLGAQRPADVAVGDQARTAMTTELGKIKPSFDFDATAEDRADFLGRGDTKELYKTQADELNKLRASRSDPEMLKREQFNAMLRNFGRGKGGAQVGARAAAKVAAAQARADEQRLLGRQQVERAGDAAFRTAGQQAMTSADKAGDRVINQFQVSARAMAEATKQDFEIAQKKIDREFNAQSREIEIALEIAKQAVEANKGKQAAISALMAAANKSMSAITSAYALQLQAAAKKGKEAEQEILDQMNLAIGIQNAPIIAYLNQLDSSLDTSTLDPGSVNMPQVSNAQVDQTLKGLGIPGVGGTPVLP